MIQLTRLCYAARTRSSSIPLLPLHVPLGEPAVFVYLRSVTHCRHVYKDNYGRAFWEFQREEGKGLCIKHHSRGGGHI